MESLLTTCTESVYNILHEAHVGAPEPRIYIKGTTKEGSFSQFVHKLKLAYAANLKNCVFQEPDEGHSKSVRGLTDIIKKLTTNCDADVAQLCAQHMQDMLKHLLEEFHWDLSAQTFEQCAQGARTEKAEAYQKALHEERQLKQYRQTAE